MKSKKNPLSPKKKPLYTVSSILSLNNTALKCHNIIVNMTLVSFENKQNQV
jgi:hypothetical protein